MSYEVEDKTKIKYWKISFTLLDGTKTSLMKIWKGSDKDKAEKENKYIGGELTPVYGRKTIETEYPTCPKCGHQGESTGEREFNYNGGGEHFRCLNPECRNKWEWS